MIRDIPVDHPGLKIIALAGILNGCITFLRQESNNTLEVIQPLISKSISLQEVK